MAQKEDFRSWADREGLSSVTIQVLQEQGFTSLDQIKAITSLDDVMDSGLLNIAECLALKRAISNLSGTQDSTTARLPSRSPPNQMHHLSNTPEHEPPQYYPSTRPSNRAVLGGGAWSSGSPGATDITSRQGATDVDREEVYRFLLVGSIGSGKSTTGNTILGKQLFPSAMTFGLDTSVCDRKVTYRDGRKFDVMDCPGLFDTRKANEELCIDIVKAVACMHPGPNAILYVISLFSRYTEENFVTYQRLKHLFDEHITKHMILLFTGGDLLERGNVSFEELFSKPLTKELQQVLAECNNRRIVFNNFASDTRPQIEGLLSMVRQMMADNKGQPYKCPRYSCVGQTLEEEVARRLEKVEKEELKRMEYVKKLEREAEQADEILRKAQKQAKQNEQERKRQIKEKEREHQRLQDEFSAQMKDRTRKHEVEIQRLQKEREDQERLLKEKEYMMTEKERQTAAKEADRTRWLEKTRLDQLALEKASMAREIEEKRLQMENSMRYFQRQMEEKRRQDEDKMNKALKEKENALEKKREEERKAAEDIQEIRDGLMEIAKQEVVARKGDTIFSLIGKTVFVGITTAIGGILAGLGGALGGFMGAMEAIRAGFLSTEDPKVSQREEPLRGHLSTKNPKVSQWEEPVRGHLSTKDTKVSQREEPVRGHLSTEHTKVSQRKEPLRGHLSTEDPKVSQREKSVGGHQSTRDLMVTCMENDGRQLSTAGLDNLNEDAIEIDNYDVVHCSYCTFTSTSTSSESSSDGEGGELTKVSDDESQSQQPPYQFCPEAQGPLAPILSYCWQAKKQFDHRGGRLQKPGSDVKLYVPQDSVKCDGGVEVHSASSVNVDNIRRRLGLSDDEQVASPFAEFSTGQDFRFEIPVSITLPHYLPTDFDPELVRVYHVKRGSSNELTVSRLDQIPPQSDAAAKETLGLKDTDSFEIRDHWFQVAERHITVFAGHFCGFVCTYCSKKVKKGLKHKPELYVMASGSISYPSAPGLPSSVDVYADIWDERIFIADFREPKSIRSGPYKLIELLDHTSDSELKISLRKDARLEYWLDSEGQLLHPGETKCFNFRSRIGCRRCAVEGRLLPMSHQWAMKSNTPLESLKVVVDVTHKTTTDQNQIVTALPLKLLLKKTSSETQTDDRLPTENTQVKQLASAIASLAENPINGGASGESTHGSDDGSTSYVMSHPSNQHEACANEESSRGTRQCVNFFANFNLSQTHTTNNVKKLGTMSMGNKYNSYDNKALPATDDEYLLLPEETGEAS